MGEAVRARSSAAPEAGFRRYRFILGKAFHGGGILAALPRDGDIADDAGKVVAQIRHSPSGCAITMDGDHYGLVEKGTVGADVLDPFDEVLAEMRTSEQAQVAHVGLIASGIVGVAIAFAGILPGDAAMCVMLPAILVSGVFLFMRQASDKSALYRAGDKQLSIREGVGLGDYRLEAGGATVARVYRDNGRTFDDYDVDVREPFDAAVLLFVVALDATFPASELPGTYKRKAGNPLFGARPAP